MNEEREIINSNLIVVYHETTSFFFIFVGPALLTCTTAALLYFVTRETSCFVPGLAQQRVRAEGRESPNERQQHQETTRKIDIHTRGRICAICMTMLTKNSEHKSTSYSSSTVEHHLLHLHRDISYIQKLKKVHDGIERSLCSTRCSEIVRPARSLFVALKFLSSTQKTQHTQTTRTSVRPREHYFLLFPFMEPLSKHTKQAYARGSPHQKTSTEISAIPRGTAPAVPTYICTIHPCSPPILAILVAQPRTRTGTVTKKITTHAKQYSNQQNTLLTILSPILHRCRPQANTHRPLQDLSYPSKNYVDGARVQNK